METSTAIVVALLLLVGLWVPYYLWYVRGGRAHGRRPDLGRRSGGSPPGRRTRRTSRVCGASGGRPGSVAARPQGTAAPTRAASPVASNGACTFTSLSK